MRTDIELGKRYRTIFSFTGLIMTLCAGIMLSPLIALGWWPDEGKLVLGFVLPAIALGAAGIALWRLLLPRKRPALSVQDGGVIVLLSWMIVTVVSATTLMLLVQLNFTQAFFESVSAWTTTGLSVVDVEKAPRLVLLWRSIMQLAGGAGMAIILVTLAGGPMGPGLSVAEGRSDQLVPHVRRSARLVFAIYVGYAAIGTVALRVAGMSWFDAVNHAFAAVSTGGFSTRSASIGYWDSSAIEVVLLPLMVLGSTNFQIAYLLLRGRFRPVWRNGEVRTAAVLAAVTVPLMLALVTGSHYPGIGKQIRVAVFEVVSALTTTGFSTVSYAGWPGMGILLLIVLMIIGGGTGSTAGAMKQYRAYVLARAMTWEIMRMGQPNRVVHDNTIWQGEGRRPLSDKEVVQVAVFAAAYLTIFVIGSAVLVANGFSVQDSFFEYASALGTVGLSVGVTSAGAPTGVLWVESIGMLLGRLEVFIVFIALRKLFVDAVAMARAAR